MRPIKFTPEESAAIQQHCDTLANGIRPKLLKYEQLPERKTNKFIAGQIQYWRNCLSCLEWVKKTAKQSKQGQKNVKRTTV